MRTVAILLLVPALLLSACGSRQGAPTPASPAAPTPGAPAAPATPAVPAAPATAGGLATVTDPNRPRSPVGPAQAQPSAAPLASQHALAPIEFSQVRYLDLAAPGPGSRQVRLHPEQDGPAIQALLTAVNGVGPNWRLSDTPGFSLSGVALVGTLQLRSGDRLTLSLPETRGLLTASWSDHFLSIDSPPLSDALVALEPRLSTAQKPGIRIWAVDPTGRKDPELLFEQAKELMLTGISPDGRYLLLEQSLAEAKGDYRGIPYLLDRTPGKLTEGRQTGIRFATWSGSGFYIDWLTHLDLQMNETRLDSLGAALNLKEREREVIASSFSGDGKRFAALVGLSWGAEKPLDLVFGNSDGSGLTVLPGAVVGTDSQVGTLARVVLSPDGQVAALSGKDGAALVRVTDPDPAKWLRIPQNFVSLNMVWAPDSRHVWLDRGEIVDLDGKVEQDLGNVYSLAWQPDGQGGVISGPDGLRSFRLGGATADLPGPDWSVPAGFLPDGRLLVWRLVSGQ